MELEGFRPLFGEFAVWLDRFHPQHRREWEKRLRADEEAALCEAMTWQLLQEQGVHVEPNADLTDRQKRPDYRCLKHDQVFYVEATCIHNGTMENKIGLPSSGSLRLSAVHWQGFLEAVFSKCRNKTPQCAKSDAPCLLLVGTLHGWASRSVRKKFLVEQLLTGESQIAWDIDPESLNTSDVYHVTELWCASVVKPAEAQVAPARCPISGLLVAGYGMASRPVCGVLHPAPVRVFDRSLLPRIEFCRL